MIPPIKYLLRNMHTPDLQEIYEGMDTLEDIAAMIEKSIEEEPPISIKEGGIIKTGYHEAVDKYRHAKTEGKQWLARWSRPNGKIQASKISVLNTIKFSVIIWKSRIPIKSLVPETWTRKQTMANAERYITPELKELEDVILGAEEKLFLWNMTYLP